MLFTSKVNWNARNFKKLERRHFKSGGDTVEGGVRVQIYENLLKNQEKSQNFMNFPFKIHNFPVNYIKMTEEKQ